VTEKTKIIETKKTTNVEIEKEIDWKDLTIKHQIGEGASGNIFEGVWHKRGDEEVDVDVAVKLFKGSMTSDGDPLHEMQVFFKFI
jgi:hypothetical protein